jgi:D-threo-aldose 1-dehydrogenase
MIDRLGFGCVALTGFATPGEALRLLNTAFDLGIRHFDTAPLYGQGYSERLVGEFLRGRRDRVTVATKFGMGPARPPNLPLPVALGLNVLRRRLAAGRPRKVETTKAPAASPTPASSRRIERPEIQAAFDASRRSLGVDHIDLYLLHEDVPAALSPDALAFLRDLRTAGQVRQIGLAASASRYQALEPADVEGWDLLQYEAGSMWPGSDGLLRRFPDQKHVFHSCLKGVTRQGDPNAAGRVLAERLAANPKGLVLFSSTRIDHLRANLGVLSR